jgi:small subunit ribosomal protein S17
MKIFKGKVIATKTAKTATVVVERIVVHPIYKKRFRRARKYQVHDELGVKIGDRVSFVTTRPISKLKKWKIIKVLGEKKKKVEAAKK